MTLEAFVNNKRLVLPPDTKVSIERNSPLLNSDTGDFSYPLEVSTEKNSGVLGHPHRMTRKTALPDQSFILKDQGLHILSGVVDYDDDGCSDKSLAIMFKSGNSKLFSRINGKTLRDLNFESFLIWAQDANQAEFEAILSDWNDYNTTPGSTQAILAPTAIDDSGDIVIANEVDTATGDLSPTYVAGSEMLYHGYQRPVTKMNAYFQFQVRIWHMLEKIFYYAGYTVAANELKDSNYSKAVLFTNPFRVTGYWMPEYVYTPTQVTLPEENRMFPYDVMSMTELMPSVDAGDFLEAIQNLFALEYRYDETAGTVQILLVKNIFEKSPISKHRLITIGEPKNSPKPAYNGYRLVYGSQDNSDDTEEDFEVSRTILTSTMPDPELEGEVVHFAQYNYYYETALDDNENLYWKRIGRLKAVVSGDEDYLQKDIGVKIPTQIAGGGAEVPKIKATISNKEQSSGVVAVLNDAYISMYRGIDQLDDISFPLLVAEQYTLYDESLSYSQVGYDEHLQLQDWTGMSGNGLIELHHWFLDWMAGSRHFIFQFTCELIDVLRLQFDERYINPDFIALFEKISYDLPFDGIVEIEGYAK